MAAISTIWDNLVTQLGILLPDHKRLSNPYDLGQNLDHYLKQGWAIAATPGGDNTQRFNTNQRSTSINFTISITRKFLARENDPTKKEITEKQLLEDVQLIIDDTHINNLESGALATFVNFEGITPITDKENFLAAVMNIAVEYFVK